MFDAFADQCPGDEPLRVHNQIKPSPLQRRPQRGKLMRLVTDPGFFNHFVNVSLSNGFKQARINCPARAREPG